MANFLRANGLRRGDHLLLLLGNVVPLRETMLAAMKLGVVVIPATTLLTPVELQDRLDRGRARAVVATQDQDGEVLGAAIRQSPACRCQRNHAARRMAPFEEASTFPGTFSPDGPRRPTIRCCSTSLPAHREAQARAAQPAQLSRRPSHDDVLARAGPGDVHLNISSPGWAKHAYSCFFAPWNAGKPSSSSTSRGLRQKDCFRSLSDAE